MKTIYCIRHGHTTGDTEGRYGGDYDDALSASGEEQIMELAAELASCGIETLYASPLLRARQTAQAIADRQGIEIHIRPALKERNRYGVLTGLTKTEAKQAFPELAALVSERMNTLPGTESDADASSRMIEAFNEVATQDGTCLAIVWHGGGMRALLRDYLGLGEVTEAGDCCWAQLVQDSTGERFRLVSSQRLAWKNGDN